MHGAGQKLKDGGSVIALGVFSFLLGWLWTFSPSSRSFTILVSSFITRNDNNDDDGSLRLSLYVRHELQVLITHVTVMN